MKINLLSLLLILALKTNAQVLELIKHKNKVGLKIGNKILFKPRFDSIKIEDEKIITSYKKSKGYYITNQGKIVAKFKDNNKSFPFQNGNGCYAKNGKWGIININNETVVPFKNIKPTKINQLYFFKNISRIIGKEGKTIASDFDSLYVINTNFQVIKKRKQDIKKEN